MDITRFNQYVEADTKAKGILGMVDLICNQSDADYTYRQHKLPYDKKNVYEYYMIIERNELDRIIQSYRLMTIAILMGNTDIIPLIPTEVIYGHNYWIYSKNFKEFIDSLPKTV